MEWLTVPALTVFGSVIGTYAVMRSQVVELRAQRTSSDKNIDALENRVTRLEERHDGLVDKLGSAVSKLEQVTGRLEQKLEALAIKLAGRK